MGYVLKPDRNRWGMEYGRNNKNNKMKNIFIIIIVVIIFFSRIYNVDQHVKSMLQYIEYVK